MQRRVDAGWKIYEDIWEQAHREFGPVGGGIAGRIKLRRTMQKWNDAGALENVETANLAMKAHLRGEDIERHFTQQRASTEKAEEPPVPVLSQPTSHETSIASDGEMSEKTAVADSEDEKDHLPGFVTLGGGDDILKKIASGMERPSVVRSLTTA